MTFDIRPNVKCQALTLLTRVFRALVAATRVVLTWVVLTPFYLLCFVPGRLILALRGRDPLRRGFPAPEASCWDPRPPGQGSERHRRPFA